MAAKRSFQQDPEYDEIPSEIQGKRMKLIESDMRNQTKKKIEVIVKTQFEQEMANKNEETFLIDDFLHETRCMLDRLRAVSVTKYYACLGQDQASSDTQIPSIHPAVKACLGKAPARYTLPHGSAKSFSSSESSASASTALPMHSNQTLLESTNTTASASVENSRPPTFDADISTRAPRFKTKCKVIVGNVSKFIPVARREENDQSTHKWMVYVRGDKNGPNLESYVRKVRFLLHPSYRPNDIVDVNHTPFHLTRRGWGEFPIRVQLYFLDPRNKPVDIIHHLKFDKTYTGLQSLGAETVAEMLLFKAEDTIKHENSLFQNLNMHSVTSVMTSSASDSLNIPVNVDTVICHDKYSMHSDHSVESHSFSKIKNLPTDIETEYHDPNSSLTVSSSHSTELQQSKEPVFPKILFSNLKSSIDQSHCNKSKVSLPKVTIPSTTNNIITLANQVNQTPNGVSPYIKCTDTEGRVLLVPQTSLICIKSENDKTSAKPNCMIQSQATSTQSVVPLPENATALGISKSKSFMKQKSNASLPSYILNVIPSQRNGPNQVLLIPVGKDSKEKTKVSTTKGKPYLTTVNGLPVQGSSIFSDATRTEFQIKKPKAKTQMHWKNALEAMDMTCYQSFTELMRRVMKIFPLINQDEYRLLPTLCAPSDEVYQSWHIGKRRGAEWMRAALVRTELINILKKNPSNFIKPEDVWSRKEIMIWCRRNGHTPVSMERINASHSQTRPSTSSDDFCSLSDGCSLLSGLRQEYESQPLPEEKDIFIDIMTVDDRNPVVNITSPVSHSTFCLPHSSAAVAYVKEAASQIGVRLKPIDIEPGVSAPVVEEMIFGVCKEFVSDVLRTALTEGYSRMGGKLCPDEVTVADVYAAIKQIPYCDSLTNQYLGVLKDPAENS